MTSSQPSFHCVWKMEGWVHVRVITAPFFTFGPLPSLWSTNQSLRCRSLVSYSWERSSSSSLFVNFDLLHLFSASWENANMQDCLDCLQWTSSTQTIVELWVWLLSQIILHVLQYFSNYKYFISKKEKNNLSVNN